MQRAQRPVSTLIYGESMSVPVVLSRPSVRADNRRRLLVQRLVGTSILMCAMLGLAARAHAWSNHALATWQVAAGVPGLAEGPPVVAETLDAFLLSEGHGLEVVLDEAEQWERGHLSYYPARPSELRYQFNPNDSQRRAHFLAALRVNAQVPLKLFVQRPPGTQLSAADRMPVADISILRHSQIVARAPFERLESGSIVAAADVLASASDEPDYGLDIDLFSDNPGSFGRLYGFGKEPFGNPALEYSTQAPFHMGFFHESPIIFQAAPFLTKTLPEYRIHLYLSLARHALGTGHRYWGLRFAGWALHYVQDLTQPYHARVLPNEGVLSMLGTNVVDMLGWHTPKRSMVVLVSNRHQALENYQYHRMYEAYRASNSDDPLLLALRMGASQIDRNNTGIDVVGWVRRSISVDSAAMADATDTCLRKVLPAKYVEDPDYIFGETEPDIDLFQLSRDGRFEDHALVQNLSGLMLKLGHQTRSLIDRVIVRPQMP